MYYKIPGFSLGIIPSHIWKSSNILFICNCVTKPYGLDTGEVLWALVILNHGRLWLSRTATLEGNLEAKYKLFATLMYYNRITYKGRENLGFVVFKQFLYSQCWQGCSFTDMICSSFMTSIVPLSMHAVRDKANLHQYIALASTWPDRLETYMLVKELFPYIHVLISVSCHGGRSYNLHSM